MKPFLVVNPNAGGKRLGDRWSDRIRPLIESRLGPFPFEFSSHPGHAREIASRALRDGHDLIVAVGGDGTLNEVVNGFMAAPEQMRSSASLGVLPFGSGGDFARTANLPRRLEGALETLLQSEARPIDVGLAEFDDPALSPRHFINIANAGVVANVMLQVNPMPRAYPALLRYLWGTVKGFRSFRDVVADLEIDGHTRTLEGVTDVLVANGRYFGRGMQPAPGALLDDGLFDVVLLKGTSLARFARFLPRLYSGDIPTSSSIHESFRCQSLRVRTHSDARSLHVEMDGENHGRAPVTFRILKHALRLRAPR